MAERGVGHLCTLGISIALCWLASCASQPVGEPAPTGRLPSDTRPLGYQLELEIDPTKLRFAGRVEIEVELDRARSTLWLHALDLAVTESYIALPDGARLAARFEAVDPTGVAALRLAEPLGPGRARIVLAWEAPFAAGLRGLYRVEQGEDAYAFTQMEPIDARRAFPGFDEPVFKVPFDVSLVVPSDVVALANTPELSSEMLPDGRVRRRYAKTTPLPTYLLAWAVGPLEVVEASPIPPNDVRSRPLPLRGVAPRGRGDRLAFALTETPAILEEIERYVGSEYPYAKLDIVAVPDFAAGAMENVGLITFRDGLLLLDPETAPVGQRRGFAGVMAHELVHMWFGDLVTMPWWDDIWLNESFATWLSARAIEALYPDHRADLYRIGSTHGAMQSDSLATARTIREPILSTHDIRNAFDHITYQKGGAVLAMFEAAAGEEAFRASVRVYLARHAHGTASSADFLAVIEQQLGAKMALAMSGFLDQSGLPLLAVDTQCVADGLRWIVEQKRFVPLGSTLSPERQWSVPLCPAVGECRWVDEPSVTFTEPLVPSGAMCRSWVHPNPGANGYYRWSLPPDELTALLELGWPELSELERLSVADALRSSYSSGSLSASTALDALSRLAADPSRAVATKPLGLLREVRDQVATDPAERSAVEGYVLQLYGSRARALGFDDAPSDDGEQKLLRGQIVSAVVVLGRDPELRAEALERGRRHLAGPAGTPDPTAASSELLDLIARVAVEDGGEDEFEAAWAHLFASEDSIVRSRMLRALAATPDEERRERARQLVFDPLIRSNERLSVLMQQAGAAETLAEREDVLRWVQKHEESIVETLSRYQAARLLGVVGGFCSEEEAVEIEAWLGERIEQWPGGPRRLAGQLERVRLCAARTEYQRASALEFFASLAAASGVEGAAQ